MGGTLVALLFVLGWILNLGHRLRMIRRLNLRQPPFPAFTAFAELFLLGLRACAAIACYLAPSLALGALALDAYPRSGSTALGAAAAALFLLAIFTLPGGMTYNAAYDDLRILYRPDRAFAIAISGGRRYLKAWAIALAAVSLSLLGLLALGVGFFYTSVWAWSVVGYAFSRALLPSLARSVTTPQRDDSDEVSLEES